MRAVRLPRAAVLLALPGMCVVGDVFAAADGRESGSRLTVQDDPRVIVALDFADAKDALELSGRLDPSAKARLTTNGMSISEARPAAMRALVVWLKKPRRVMS